MPPTKASPPTTPPKAPTTPPAAAPVLPKAKKVVPRKDEVTLAVVIGAHGIGGEVRLKVFAENFGSYKSFNNGALSLKAARNGNNGMIARFAEVADRNAAEAMRGTELTVPRASLPPLEDGEYYHTDVIGLDVVSTDGEAIGRVVAIDNFGAGDVIEIERLPVDDKPGKRFMIPMRVEAVPEWDADRLVVEASFAAE